MSLTTDAFKTIVHAFIASRLDYCNHIFHQTTAVYIQTLQSVLNAAARLIMRKRKFGGRHFYHTSDAHYLVGVNSANLTSESFCFTITECRPFSSQYTVLPIAYRFPMTVSSPHTRSALSSSNDDLTHAIHTVCAMQEPYKLHTHTQLQPARIRLHNRQFTRLKSTA